MRTAIGVRAEEATWDLDLIDFIKINYSAEYHNHSVWFRRIFRVTRRASFDVAPFWNCPEGAATNQPGATPWGTGFKRTGSPERAGQLNGVVSPFQRISLPRQRCF
jgi:hypothetical protein